MSDGFNVPNSIVSSVDTDYPTIVIDAGHGGLDPGAVSGAILEKNINLAIAEKLNALLTVFGFDTVMLRSTDVSLHSEDKVGIKNIKASDLNNRVNAANSYENALFISIHQNMYSESKYSGSQVFYGFSEGSKELANTVQHNIIAYLQNDNYRQTKKGNSLYILENSINPAVMIECGFMSNPAELTNLCDELYQQKLSFIISFSVLDYVISEAAV